MELSIKNGSYTGRQWKLDERKCNETFLTCWYLLVPASIIQCLPNLEVFFLVKRNLALNDLLINYRVHLLIHSLKRIDAHEILNFTQCTIIIIHQWSRLMNQHLYYSSCTRINNFLLVLSSTQHAYRRCKAKTIIILVDNKVSFFFEWFVANLQWGQWVTMSRQSLTCNFDV